MCQELLFLPDSFTTRAFCQSLCCFINTSTLWGVFFFFVFLGLLFFVKGQKQKFLSAAYKLNRNCHNLPYSSVDIWISWLCVFRQWVGFLMALFCLLHLPSSPLFLSPRPRYEWRGRGAWVIMTCQIRSDGTCSECKHNSGCWYDIFRAVFLLGEISGVTAQPETCGSQLCTQTHTHTHINVHSRRDLEKRNYWHFNGMEQNGTSRDGEEKHLLLKICISDLSCVYSVMPLSAAPG